MQLDESFQPFLQLDQWDRFSLAECEEVAHDLWKVLPAPFRFHKVKTCSLDDQQHHVAVFEWAGYPDGYHHRFFALIPGGEATLGYDREHPFVPNQHQKESWAEETERTGMFGPLDAFLDQFMTPFRHVLIEPFLLKVLPTPLSLPPVFDQTVGGKGVWRSYATPISYEKTLLSIARQGFSYPTDELCCRGTDPFPLGQSARWKHLTKPFLSPLQHVGPAKLLGKNAMSRCSHSKRQVFQQGLLPSV